MIHFKSEKIMIPVDFSDTSLLAIKHGAFLAQLTKGDIYLIHVINKIYESYSVVSQEVSLEMEKISAMAGEKLEEVANKIRKDYGVNVTTFLNIGNATHEIIKEAEENNISLIVMGTHGYSPLEELVIGSNALKVITKSPCPVMAMSEMATKFGYHNVLLPIDTSSHSRQKAIYAMEMAKHFNSHIYCVGILTVDEKSEKGAMEIIMKQITDLAAEKHVTCTSEILSGIKNRASATVNYGQKVKADLIIIMTDQDAEISGFFLGPFSQQVIHLSKVPVIAVKPEDHPENISWTVLSGTSGL